MILLRLRWSINEHATPHQLTGEHVLLPEAMNVCKVAVNTNSDSSIAHQQIHNIDWVDYCNSLLAGQPAYQLKRVQSILNFAKHLIFGSGKYGHIIAFLQFKLHWLHVPHGYSTNAVSWCTKPCMHHFQHTSHTFVPGFWQLNIVCHVAPQHETARNSEINKFGWTVVSGSLTQ